MINSVKLWGMEPFNKPFEMLIALAEVLTNTNRSDFAVSAFAFLLILSIEIYLHKLTRDGMNICKAGIKLILPYNFFLFLSHQP